MVVKFIAMQCSAAQLTKLHQCLVPHYPSAAGHNECLIQLGVSTRAVSLDSESTGGHIRQNNTRKRSCKNMDLSYVLSVHTQLKFLLCFVFFVFFGDFFHVIASWHAIFAIFQHIFVIIIFCIFHMTLLANCICAVSVQELELVYTYRSEPM